MAIIVFRDDGKHRPASWSEARAMFVAAIQADEGVSVWDADEETNSAVELWRFDGAARQAAMRKDIPA